MDLTEAVHRRRMVRNFGDEPVPRETVERIVDLARHAPSAGFSQGVSFVAVTDPQIRRQVAELSDESGYVSRGMDPFISRAPVQIIVCASEKVYRDRYREPDKLGPNGEEIEWPVPYWFSDAGCAQMLLHLGAVNEGLETAFVGTSDPSALQRLLGIPDDFWPIGVVLIGHGAPDVPSPSLQRGRRPRTTVLHWEHW